MGPLKTHDAISPQQGLLQTAERSPLSPLGHKTGDIVLTGHGGANPHVDQREPTGTLHTPRMPANTFQELDFGSAGTSNTKILTRLDIFKLLSGKNKTLSLMERVNIVLAAATIGNACEISKTREEITKTLPVLLSKCDKMFKGCKFNIKYFTNKHAEWLSATFISSYVTMDQPVEDTLLSSPKSSQFLNMSSRQQIRSRKRLQAELEDEPQIKKIKAFVKSLKIEGEPLSQKNSKALESIITVSLESENGAIHTHNKVCSETPKPYSADEALAMIIDKKMSVDVYNFLHNDLKERGYPCFPPYYKVIESKQKCYPESIQIDEKEATVPLQCLLQHTFERILHSQEEVFRQYCEANGVSNLECEFVGSWGFDGSSGQALYKQKFDGMQCESSLFATTFVPLQILVKSSSTDPTILWMNPAPQSYRSCRPIRIVYAKENKELILAEEKRVQNEKQNLIPLKGQLATGQTIAATCNLYLAAIDGKVLNVLLNTSSQMRCPYCSLLAKQFNDLETVYSKPVDDQLFKHGISPLHAWIRVLEFLLKLGYKKEVQSWYISKKSDEGHRVEERKKQIQNEIRQKIGVLVDVVRPNSGTTNDGNTARTVLSDKYRETFANILGLEKWLLDDLHTVLVVLSSGLPIHAEKFGIFCKELAKKYVETYGWLPMTVTIHKILAHGAAIIRNSSVPVGMLSEQAAESRNKYWRHDREHHTRKSDRIKTMSDLYQRALVSSDPIISAQRMSRRIKNIKKRPLPSAAVALLKAPQSPQAQESQEEIPTPTSEFCLDDSYYEVQDGVESLAVENDP